MGPACFVTPGPLLCLYGRPGGQRGAPLPLRHDGMTRLAHGYLLRLISGGRTRAAAQSVTVVRLRRDANAYAGQRQLADIPVAVQYGCPCAALRAGRPLPPCRHFSDHPGSLSANGLQQPCQREQNEHNAEYARNAQNGRYEQNAQNLILKKGHREQNEQNLILKILIGLFRPN
jgi:hypothetical protein